MTTLADMDCPQAAATTPPRRVRVLLTTSDLIGRGAEREFACLLQHLSRERFEPIACFWRERFDYPLPADVPCHVLGKTRPWHARRTIARLASLIDELRPEVVFSQLHYVNLVTGSALTRCRHQPAWLCRFTNDPRRELPWPLSAWARRVLPRATRVLGCCEGVTRELLRYLGLETERVGTAWNLVDLDEIRARAAAPPMLARSPGAFTVVAAGQFVAQKNHALLLEALARLDDRRVELWMLGRGPLAPALRAAAERLGIERQVRWLGHVENPFPLLRQADALVLSSDHEGLPNVVIEAMACGTPVVATRCPFGPDELIDDGVEGLLVPPGDVAALAAALRRLMDDRDLREAMRTAATARVDRQFALGKNLAAYEAMFQSAAASSAPRLI